MTLGELKKMIDKAVEDHPERKDCRIVMAAWGFNDYEYHDISKIKYHDSFGENEALVGLF